MNNEHSEDLPREQPAFARVPPWPPKETARDLEDDGRPCTIKVLLTEHRQQPDKTESSLPIADFTFDSSRTKHEQQTLMLRDIPPLSVFAHFLAEGDGMLSVSVSESRRDLVSLHLLSPYSTRSTFRLSGDTTISIIVSRHKVWRDA